MFLERQVCKSISILKDGGFAVELQAGANRVDPPGARFSFRTTAQFSGSSISLRPGRLVVSSPPHYASMLHRVVHVWELVNQELASTLG